MRFSIGRRPQARAFRDRPSRGSILFRFSLTLFALNLFAAPSPQQSVAGTSGSNSTPDLENQFKYGSLSSRLGFPLSIWKVLPEMFPDKLPGGWTSLGLTVEPGRELPVGFGKRTVGYTGVTPNCALCHSGAYRTSATAQAVLVLGAPAHEFDFDRFNKVMSDCVQDRRFTAKNVFQHIAKSEKLSWFRKCVYRLVLIPATKAKIASEKKKTAWQALRPATGRGRTDAFNRLKITELGLLDDGTIGTSDYPPLWDQESRPGLWLHWNGSGNKLNEENLLSVLPIIGKPRAFLPHEFQQLTNVLFSLKPPAFPFPIDKELASRGKIVFDQRCADCHAFGSKNVGQVTPLAEIGTDPHFLKMWTPKLVAKLRSINHAPFTFSSVRVTDGYVNTPLDGCWMRAPFLHNGSVPNLWSLLQPVEKRPSKFYRGNNIYDPVKMGFFSTGTEAVQSGTEYDTSLPGNGNGGHTYGVDLLDSDKQALLEYMKTL